MLISSPYVFDQTPLLVHMFWDREVMELYRRTPQNSACTSERPAVDRQPGDLAHQLDKEGPNLLRSETHRGLSLGHMLKPFYINANTRTFRSMLICFGQGTSHGGALPKTRAGHQLARKAGVRNPTVARPNRKPTGKAQLALDASASCVVVVVVVVVVVALQSGV